MSDITKEKWAIKSRFLIVNEEGKIIANVQPMAKSDEKMTFEESEDNAKIIAEAPETAQQRDDLLAALVKCLIVIEADAKLIKGYLSCDKKKLKTETEAKVQTVIVEAKSAIAAAK